MPLKFGWPKKGGTDQKAKLVNEDALTEEEKKDFKRGVLHLKKAKQTFVFSGVNPQSIPSLNRGFSAPVTIEAPYSFSDLSFLLANDCDEFNRYEASVQMATQTIMNLAHKKWTESDIPKDYGKAFWRVLIDEKLDPHLKAYALSLPSEAVLHLEGEAALVHEIHGARNTLAHFLVTPHWDEMKRMFLKLDKATQGKYSIKPEMVAKRALKNTLLHYLVCISPMGTELAEGQYYKATNLTDQLSALQALLWYDQEAGHKASDHFYKMWKHEGLVIQKWIAAHMAIPDPISLEWLHKIEKDHIFDKKIPNFVRSLYRAFMNNHAQFHRTDGLGYHTIAERILEIDKINPQMGAGLAKGFALFERLPHHLKGHAEKSLERILNGQLSKNTFEIVSKTVVRN